MLELGRKYIISNIELHSGQFLDANLCNTIGLKLLKYFILSDCKAGSWIVQFVPYCQTGMTLWRNHAGITEPDLVICHPLQVCIDRTIQLSKHTNHFHSRSTVCPLQLLQPQIHTLLRLIDDHTYSSH